MEDGPEVNILADVSRILGVLAVLVFSINLFWRHATIAFFTSLVIVPIALVAAITGVLAMSQIRRSEGGQRGNKIAQQGIALAAIASLSLVVWIFVMLGSCSTMWC